MQEHLKFYIDGEWVDPATPATLDVINPTTERLLRRLAWVVLPMSKKL